MVSDPAIIQQQLSKYGMGSLWNPSDPLITEYEQIALSYRTTKVKGNLEFLMANLISRQVLYFHKSPGDCGSPAQYQTNAAINIGKFGSLGASTAVGVSTALGAAALGPGAIVALPFVIIGMIGAHHAAAVQKEQAVLCAVSTQVNAAFASVDAAVQNGQLEVNSNTSTGALQALDLIGTQADQFISQVRQDCNAGCVIQKAIHCLIDLRKYIYKSAQTNAGGAGAVAAATSLVKSNAVGYAALAAIAAKFAGVF